MNTQAQAHTKAPTQNGIAILGAVAKGNHDRGDIAKKLGFSIPQVNGSLRVLAQNGLVEISQDGMVNNTPDASQFVQGNGSKTKTVKASRAADESATRAPRKGTKMEAARKVFTKFAERGRQVVLAKLQDIGLTEKGSATYYQTLRAQSGMSVGIAAQKKAPAKAKIVKTKPSAAKKGVNSKKAK